MKKTRHLVATRMVMITLLSTLSIIGYASPGGLEDDPGVPLDGGACLLIASGVAYGLKRMRRSKEQQRDS
jgi:hypothetical protein